MTISSTTVITRTDTNGATSTFNFGHPFNNPDDLNVYLVSTTTGVATLQVRDTDYTVSANGNEHLVGGSITFIDDLGDPEAPAGGQVCVILRDPDLIQDFNPSGHYPSAGGESALDRIYQILQLNDWRIGRGIRQSDTEAAATLELPVTSDRAGKALIFDESGNVAVGDTASDISEAAEAARDLAQGFAAAASVSASTAESAANTATSAKNAAVIAKDEAEQAQGLAEAAQAAAEQAETNAGNSAQTATSEASNASDSANLAQDWATKTNGIVAATDYAAKAWAIGGTDVTDTAGRGAAKEWATKAEDSTVDGSGYSALHWAAKADASRTAAETAETNAETAESNAEAAQLAAETAQGLAETAQGLAETARTGSETAQGLAEAAQSAAESAQDYAEEWATKAEDSPVSSAAGGDDSTTFSSLHWAAKAEAFAASVNPSNLVNKSLFDANTILAANTDDTPAAVTVAEATLVGRETGGNIAALSVSAVRTLLTLVVGTDVQAYAANLDSWSLVAPSAYVTASDLASNSNGEGASLVGIEDSGGLITATTVEGALAEIATNVSAMGTPVQLKGEWDASTGSFPGGGAAQAGWSYIVSTGGTVDSIAFTANDRIVAITANASTSTYAANWLKLDYTDQVLSVAGKTGAVTLAAGDIASGTFDDARIAESNVTQHEAAIDHDALANFVGNEHIDHSGVSISAGDGLTGGGDITSSRSLAMTSNQRTKSINVVIGSAGSTLITGIKGFVRCDFSGTITAATALADQSGDVVVDIWKDTFANYPPTDADSITASAPVTISSGTNSEDTTLSGWTTAITAGDVLGFNVDSVTDIEQVTIILTVLAS